MEENRDQRTGLGVVSFSSTWWQVWGSRHNRFRFLRQLCQPLEWVPKKARVGEGSLEKIRGFGVGTRRCYRLAWWMTTIRRQCLRVIKLALVCVSSRLALVRLIMVFIESQRFTHIRQLVYEYCYCPTKCDLIWHQTQPTEIRTWWDQAGLRVIKLALVRLIMVLIVSQRFPHIRQLVYEYCYYSTKCDFIWHHTQPTEIRTWWEQAVTKVPRERRRHFNEVVIYTSGTYI
jgi:hypothetical protein